MSAGPVYRIDLIVRRLAATAGCTDDEAKLRFTRGEGWCRGCRKWTIHMSTARAFLCTVCDRERHRLERIERRTRASS